MAGTGGLASPSVSVGAGPGAHSTALPFRTELSLAPLIRFWTQFAAYSELGRGPLPGIVRERIKQAPELSAVIDDVSVIATHQQLVDLMMSAMFPPGFWEQEYGAALFPFQLRAFYATSLFRRTLMNDDGTLRGRVNGDEQRLGAAKLLLAYELIFERTYGIDLGIEIPVVFTSEDPATTLERHFRLDFDWRFVDVKLDGPAPKLTEAMRRHLESGNVELDQLRDIVPPERVTLRGFMTLKAVDVTDQEVLSSLKRDLIDKESIVSSARFESLQAKLRTLFRRPGLQLGLAAVEGDRVLVLNDATSHDHACIFADSAHHKTSEFTGSLYERAVIQNRPVIIGDLAAWPDRTRWEEELVAAGARTFVCAPLHYQDRVIGTFELTSPRPGDLNATHLPKLEEVLPLFSMAVQRSVEELEARVQAMIKEKCTAIHPVVEWRFRKAVFNTIERKSESVPDAAAEMEPIVFENVYPLYGLADIRGASVQRGVAIQADLLTQLGLAADVLRAAGEARSLPALDELRYRVDKRIAQVQRNLNSGDEIGIVAFLRANVESLFDQLGKFGTDVIARIKLYRSALDARLGVVYRRRQLFEESVNRIAEAISAYLDREEVGADHVPALLREAEDGRRGLPDLRRPEPARGRPLRPHRPHKSAPLAAHAHVRHRRARPPAPRSAARAARDHPPDSGAAHATVHPLPFRREALRRRRRVRPPLRDRQEEHRQSRGRRHFGPRNPARQDRHHLQSEPRGARVPRVHRVPAKPGLPDQ